MTSTQRPINVTVQTATPHAPAAGGRVFVLVTVSGQGQQSETNRRPLNLALVLDRSGSMEGDKLALVKNAALHLIHQLDVRDRVALVTYDQDVEVRVPSTPVAPAMLPTMSMALAAIASGGSTNLEGGWHAGVQAVAQQMGAMPGALTRVLLLTDGLANVGITEPAALASLALGAAQLGVVTSTFGVGTGYDENLLAAMAEAGSGNDYFIAGADAIHATFQAELRELMDVVAEGVTLTLTVPDGVTAALLNPGVSVTETASGLTVPVGFVGATEHRAFVFALTLPVTDVGADLTLHASATWKPSGSMTTAVPWVVAAEAGTPNEVVLAAVAAQEAARARQEAYLAEKAGDHARATRTLQNASQSIASYAPLRAASMAMVLNDEASEMAAGSSAEQRKRMFAWTQRVKRGKDAEPR